MTTYQNREECYENFLRWRIKVSMWLDLHPFVKGLYLCSYAIIVSSALVVGVRWFVLLVFWGGLDGEPLPIFGSGWFSDYIWFPAHWIVLSSVAIISFLFALSCLLGQSNRLEKSLGIIPCLLLISLCGPALLGIVVMQEISNEVADMERDLSDVVVLVDNYISSIERPASDPHVFWISGELDEEASENLFVNAPFVVVDSTRLGSGYIGQDPGEFEPHDFRICPHFRRTEFEIAECPEEVRGVFYIDRIRHSDQQELRCFVIDATGPEFRMILARTFRGGIDGPVPGGMVRGHHPLAPYSAALKWLRRPRPCPGHQE